MSTYLHGLCNLRNKNHKSFVGGNDVEISKCAVRRTLRLDLRKENLNVGPCFLVFCAPAG